MTIPIWSEDLSLGRISKLARFVRNRWPQDFGSAPSNLSSAQQFVARGLGYKDLHDLQKSAVTAETPRLPHNWIAITDELAWNLSGLTEACIPQASEFALQWPLRELRIGSCYGRSGFVIKDPSASFYPAEALAHPLDNQPHWLEIARLTKVRIAVRADGQVLVGEALENAIDIAGQHFGATLSASAEANEKRLEILEHRILPGCFMPVSDALRKWKSDALPTWLRLVTVTDSDGKSLGHAIVHRALNAVLARMLDLDEAAVAQAVSAILQRKEGALTHLENESGAASERVFLSSYEPWFGAPSANQWDDQGDLETRQTQLQLVGRNLRAGESFVFQGFQFSRLPGLLTMEDGNLPEPLSLPSVGRDDPAQDFQLSAELLPGVLPDGALDAYNRIFDRVVAIANGDVEAVGSLPGWFPNITSGLDGWEHRESGTARYLTLLSEIKDIGHTLQMREACLRALPTETVGALAWSFVRSHNKLREAREPSFDVEAFTAFVFLKCLGDRGEISNFFTTPESRATLAIASRIATFLGDPTSIQAERKLAEARASLRKFRDLLESLSFCQEPFLETLDLFLGDWQRADPRFTMVCQNLF